jgi:thiol-disulfide isomerase/thioredoxin/Tfp pilus assembly protein PilF
MNRTLISALIFAAVAGNVPALDIGDKAPSLAGIKTWIGGDPVDTAPTETKAIRVVEFWATWCPPCRETIPHLSELQKKFADRGVTIMGVTDEAEDVVRPFLETLKLSYRIAIDADKKVSEAYMKDEDGIPHAFVVDATGMVVWHGHPMDGLEDVLFRLVEGRFDPEKARTARERQNRLMAALQQGDVPAALKAVDEMLADDAKNLELYQMKAGLLMQGGDPAPIEAHFARMVEVFRDSPGELNDIAWMMVAPSPLPLPQRDLRLAYEAIRRAVKLTGGAEPAMLDTLALVYCSAGLPDQAVETQKRAIELARDPEQKKGLEAQLGYFQSVLRAREAIRTAEAEVPEAGPPAGPETPKRE